MKYKPSPFLVGFIQALLVIIYCAFVASIMQNGERWFGKINEPFIGILLILLLLSTSVLLCALFVGAYPLYLYLADPKANLKNSLRVVGWSAVWLLLFLCAFFILLWII